MMKKIVLSDFEVYCKATQIQIVLYWHRNRPIDKRTEKSPELTITHTRAQLVLDKDASSMEKV